MKHPLITACCALLTALLAGQPAYAELYRWVDENGVTQYSDKPPPAGTPVETMEVRTAPADPAAAEALEETIENVDALRDERIKAEAAKQLAKEEQAVKEENCRRARARLASYSVPNALIAQEDGSRTRVDEETRQRETQVALEMIEKYCESP